MPVDAREAILNRVRMANASLGLPATPAPETWAAIPRDFRRSSMLPRAELLELLTDRLHDYDAQVLHCSAADVPVTITRMLNARGVTRMLVPQGLDATLLPTDLDFVPDDHLSAQAMDGLDGVLTGCTLAIAETGTLVLQNVAGQGRRAATLVPDYHLCLVDAASVVATVPEAIARLEPSSSLPTTFISGPSATADIEMTRIKGVHGPRFLDVILYTA